MTILQELIKQRHQSFDAIKFVKFFDDNYNKLLELEKKHIIDAYLQGSDDCIIYTNTNSNMAEEYFNETHIQ